ncbi:hypothetical protein, partial [Riemerella anatipestifer]|uniref:hypothetical protein n=1 Tax=Riemerella anatipestifer TaxID=34085 RepID=UPI001BD9378E
LKTSFYKLKTSFYKLKTSFYKLKTSIINEYCFKISFLFFIFALSTTKPLFYGINGYKKGR